MLLMVHLCRVSAGSRTQCHKLQGAVCSACLSPRRCCASHCCAKKLTAVAAESAARRLL